MIGTVYIIILCFSLLCIFSWILMWLFRFLKMIELCAPISWYQELRLKDKSWFVRLFAEKQGLISMFFMIVAMRDAVFGSHPTPLWFLELVICHRLFLSREKAQLIMIHFDYYSKKEMEKNILQRDIAQSCVKW